MKNLLKIWILLMSIAVIPVQANAPELHSTAVFYAADLPLDLLGQFQRVIVEADNVKPAELQALHQQGAKVLAYLSIGEIAPSRRWYKQIKPSWVLGKNRVWDSEIMDITNPNWQQFIVEELVTPLVKQGYDGFFLDTLDSFQILAKTDESRNKQAQALVTLLQSVRTKYPNIQLVANRGFELMPQIAPLLDAVLAESLYAAWDNAHQTFKPSTATDTDWLLQKLHSIQQNFGLEIIVLDYLSPTQHAEALRLAQRIREQGFVPWISTAPLNTMGVGMVDITPKTFLLLFDSVQDAHNPNANKQYDAAQQALHERGYQARLHDVQSGLPNASLIGRYAGILTATPFTTQSKTYQSWLLQQQNEGMLITGLRTEANIPDEVMPSGVGYVNH